MRRADQQGNSGLARQALQPNQSPRRRGACPPSHRAALHTPACTPPPVFSHRVTRGRPELHRHGRSRQSRQRRGPARL